MHGLGGKDPGEQADGKAAKALMRRIGSVG